MKYPILLLAAAIWFSCLAAGCAGPPYAMKPAGKMPAGEARVRLADRAAYRALRLVSENAQSAPDGQMTVTVEILNCKSKPFWAEVRVVFLDESGREIREDETNWRPEYFPANDTRQLIYRSLTNRAQNYRMTLREKAE